MTFGLPQGIAHRSRQMTARAPHTHFIRLDLWNMCFRLFNDQGQWLRFKNMIHLTRLERAAREIAQRGGSGFPRYLPICPSVGGLILKCDLLGTPPKCPCERRSNLEVSIKRVQSQARALLAPRAKQAGCWLPKSEPGWCRGCTRLWSTGRPATASACLELILSTVTSALQPKWERDLISS